MEHNNTFNYELLKSSLQAIVLHVSSIILSYIFMLLIAKHHGAEGIGIFALTFTYISIGVIFSKLGLDISTMKYVSRLYKNQDERGIKNIYLTSLLFITILSIVFSIIFYFLAYFFSVFIFSEEYLYTAFSIGAFIIIPMALCQFHAEIIRSYQMIVSYFFIKNISHLLMCIILLYFGFTANISNYVYLDIYLISHYLTLAIAFMFWIKKTNILNIKSKKSIATNLLFKSSLPIMLTSTIILIMGFIDIIMLGLLTTNQEVGIYNIALKFSSITSIALVAVNSIIAPKISQLWDAKDMLNLQNIISSAAKIIFFISSPILIIYFIFPEDILSIFGEEFILGSTALIILSAGQFCNAITGPVGQVLNMTDNENILRNTAFISMIINVLLNYYLIPIYGISGAAISTAISSAFWNFLCVFVVYKKINIKTYFLPKLSK